MQSLRTPAQSLFGAATRSRNYSLPARLPRTITTARSLSTAVRPVADRTSLRPNRSISNPSPDRSFHSSTVNMSVTVINSKKEFTEALNAEGLMVLDCFATWCGPCKMIAPKIEEFAKTYDKARFYKIDVDQVPDVAQELSIRAMPTICFFKGGEKLDDVVGANPPAIEAQIKAGLA